MKTDCFCLAESLAWLVCTVIHEKRTHTVILKSQLWLEVLLPCRGVLILQCQCRRVAVLTAM